MHRNTYPKSLLFVLLLIVMALIIACGAAPTDDPPPPEPTAAEVEPTEVPPTPTEEIVETEKEEEDTASEDVADEAADEEDQEFITEVVEQSDIAQAQETGGTIVVSDEDVSVMRTNYGGDYRDISTSDAVSFHRYKTTDATSSGYQGQVWSGAMLRLHEDTLDYIPHMAESYSISEDNLTFTFNLRQNMKWSDGEPITAHDFAWTYEQMIDPVNEWPRLNQYDFVTSYQAVDDYTIEIKIEEVYAPALGQVSSLVIPYPKHIWQDLDWSDPALNPEINHPSVVSGPYTVAEWKRDEYIIFEANENYWYKGEPNLSSYTIEIVPDQDIAYQKMKTGETDTGPITAENLDEARELENITVYEWWPVASSWFFTGLNMREGFPTHDINVRHALNYAVDKQLLTDEIMLGQARRICSIYPDTSWVYNPEVPCYDYDPDKAIELFEKAGYTYQDEQMLDENGEQLTLTMIYGPNTSKTFELIAVTMQDYLNNVGVIMEIEATDWATFLETKSADEPTWDMFLGGWRSTIEPHIMFTIWAEDSIPNLNAVAYINKDVEAIYDVAGGTYDNEFRKEKYQEIQQIIADEAPYIFLFYKKSWSGQNNRILGIDPKPVGISWNSLDWYVED